MGKEKSKGEKSGKSRRRSSSKPKLRFQGTVEMEREDSFVLPHPRRDSDLRHSVTFQPETGDSLDFLLSAVLSPRDQLSRRSTSDSEVRYGHPSRDQIQPDTQQAGPPLVNRAYLVTLPIPLRDPLPYKSGRERKRVLVNSDAQVLLNLESLETNGNPEDPISPRKTARSVQEDKETQNPSETNQTAETPTTEATEDNLHLGPYVSPS
jgi:hypothetical protein